MSAVINYDRPLTQGCHFSRHEKIILPCLYPKPTIKSLSGKRRSWAKNHKYYLTGDDRINAELIIRQLKLVNYEIADHTPCSGRQRWDENPEAFKESETSTLSVLTGGDNLAFRPQKIGDWD